MIEVKGNEIAERRRFDPIQRIDSRFMAFKNRRG